MEQRPRPFAIARDLVRSPGFRWGMGIGGGLVAALGGLAVVFVVQARSTECAIRQHPPLSMQELIDVRRRFDAYRERPDAGLQLTGEELSMLLEAEVPMFVEVTGQYVNAQVALPSGEGRCWPVDFQGELTVADGVAFLIPESLRIGQVDLTPITRGMRLELLPEHMPTSRAASFLRQTRSASVSSGQMVVELAEPSNFSWKAAPR